MKRVVLLLAALGGCKPTGTTSTEGAQIFAAYCVRCHGPNGQPPADMVARFKVRDLTSPEFRAKVTPALVDEQVRHGSKNGLMPAFKDQILDEQIRAVAEFVASSKFVPP